MLNLIKKLNLTKKLLTDNANREYNANIAFNKYAKYKRREVRTWEVLYSYLPVRWQRS